MNTQKATSKPIALPAVRLSATFDRMADTHAPTFLAALRRTDALDVLPISTWRRYRAGKLPLPIQMMLAYPSLIEALAKDAEAMGEGERAALVEGLHSGIANRSDVRKRVRAKTPPKKGAKKQ